MSYVLRNINLDKLADYIRNKGDLAEIPALHLLDTVKELRTALSEVSDQRDRLVRELKDAHGKEFAEGVEAAWKLVDRCALNAGSVGCVPESAVLSIIADRIRALAPPEECRCCNGRGEIGGFVGSPDNGGYQTDPCPECSTPDRSEVDRLSRRNEELERNLTAHHEDNLRLREALERIAGPVPASRQSTPVSYLQGIAREALGGEVE